MPRQPYDRNKLNYPHYAIGASILSERPQFSSAIGKCIAIWSYVDNEIGNLFALLLGTDSEAAREVFLSIRKTSNQIDALNTVAKYAIKDGDREIFDGLIKKYASLEKERNFLAHSCFGVAHGTPEVLLAIEIRHHVHFQVTALTTTLDDPHALLKQNMYIYKIEDLDDLYSEMEVLWKAAFDFNSYLRYPNGVNRPKLFSQLFQQFKV